MRVGILAALCISSREFIIRVPCQLGTQTENSYKINPKSDCIYHFPIDLKPNGRSFGFKSTGKW